MDPRGTVGSIYKGQYYTLVHTTYESSGPHGFGEEDFGLNTSLLINSHIAIMTINKSKDQKTSFKEAYMNLLLT